MHPMLSFVKFLYLGGLLLWSTAASLSFLLWGLTTRSVSRHAFNVTEPAHATIATFMLFFSARGTAR